MKCIHRNGDITGYMIHVIENNRIEVVGDVREATISGLTPSTVYTVSVAAVNNQGPGPYSDGIDQSTNGKLASLGYYHAAHHTRAFIQVHFHHCQFILHLLTL